MNFSPFILPRLTVVLPRADAAVQSVVDPCNNALYLHIPKPIFGEYFKCFMWCVILISHQLVWEICCVCGCRSMVFPSVCVCVCVSQVLLRYHVQRGISVIPKSDRAHHILENTKVTPRSFLHSVLPSVIAFYTSHIFDFIIVNLVSPAMVSFPPLCFIGPI